MSNGVKLLRALLFATSLAALGCHAQTPAPPLAQPAAPTSTPQPIQIGVKLPPDLARRIEVMIRSKSDIPVDYTITISDPAKSDITGFDLITVSFAPDGKPAKSAPFLLSVDGKTLAQLNRFDIGQDPAAKISALGRPARGGPENAPVTIVGFDDLECPFCAMLHAELFPAILDRYKDQVRIVYRDFPLEQHLWAKHAAVDANCLGDLSTVGYWNFVDYVHTHAADIAGTEKTTAKAEQNLDKLALDEGTHQKVNAAKLSACIVKQDAAAVNSSILQGEADPLRIESVPTLFINGEKVTGNVPPIELIYRIIDRALVAAGQTPPPLPPAATPPAVKPGS